MSRLNKDTQLDLWGNLKHFLSGCSHNLNTLWHRPSPTDNTISKLTYSFVYWSKYWKIMAGKKLTNLFLFREPECNHQWLYIAIYSLWIVLHNRSLEVWLSAFRKAVWEELCYFWYNSKLKENNQNNILSPFQWYQLNSLPIKLGLYSQIFLVTVSILFFPPRFSYDNWMKIWKHWYMGNFYLHNNYNLVKSQVVQDTIASSFNYFLNFHNLAQVESYFLPRSSI